MIERTSQLLLPAPKDARLAGARAAFRSGGAAQDSGPVAEILPANATARRRGGFAAISDERSDAHRPDRFLDAPERFLDANEISRRDRRQSDRQEGSAAPTVLFMAQHLVQERLSSGAHIELHRAGATAYRQAAGDLANDPAFTLDIAV